MSEGNDGSPASQRDAVVPGLRSEERGTSEGATREGAASRRPGGEWEGTERQVPFYCPYCGDQDLRPAGAAGGSWQCASCARGFELHFTGVVRAGQVTS